MPPLRLHSRPPAAPVHCPALHIIPTDSVGWSNKLAGRVSNSGGYNLNRNAKSHAYDCPTLISS